MIEPSHTEAENPNDGDRPYQLDLYVTGRFGQFGAGDHQSETHLRDASGGQLSLQVIDIHQQKQAAEQEQLIACRC